jgi:hypothetical protein
VRHLREQGRIGINPPLQTEWLGLLDAGARWAWIAVMPPADGFGDVVEGRSLRAFRFAVEKAEMEFFVVAL